MESHDHATKDATTPNNNADESEADATSLPPPTWGSSRLRERRTLRITERLAQKKSGSLKSKLSATKSEESGDTIDAGSRRGSENRPQSADDANVVVRGRGRPRKRQSDSHSEVVNKDVVLRKLRSSTTKDGGNGNATENVNSQEPERNEGNASSVDSPWGSRLRGRAKKKLCEEDVCSSGSEDPSEDKEVDTIALPNVNFDHIQKLEEETKYQCTICMKKFRNESSKTIHVSCKLNEKFFTCEYCRQKDLTKAEYESHLEKHTGKQHFVCHYCGEWFLKRRKWIFHILLHEGRSHFFCKPCKKRFPYFRRKPHVRLHNGDQQFTCQRCKEQFIVNVNEKEICDEEKQPAGICSSCGEKFKTKFKYYSHVLTESRCHYSCDECSSQFARKKSPFKCRTCRAEFTRRSILESHKKCLHPSPPKEAQDQKPRSPRKVKTIKKFKTPGPGANEEPELTCESPTVITTPTAGSESKTESVPVVQESKETVGEPIEPLSSVTIKTISGSVFIFERVASTQEKWQQTNTNNTEHTLDYDFCSQCHYSFNQSSSYSVNTMCGHLLCESCFLDNNDGCLLCMDTTDHFEIQNLDNEDKDALASAIKILKKLTAQRIKGDTPDVCINENENVDPAGVEHPILMSCVRGAVEKSISEKSNQFP